MNWNFNSAGHRENQLDIWNNNECNLTHYDRRSGDRTESEMVD